MNQTKTAPLPTEFAKLPEASGGDLPPAAETESQARRGRPFSVWWLLAAGYAVLIGAVFGSSLAELASHALASDLHSHVVLVPFITAYLIYVRWEQLPNSWSWSVWGAVPLIIGVVCWGMGHSMKGAAGVSHNDVLAVLTLGFVCCVVAGVLGFLGRRWAAAALFPLAFLFFMVPLPDGAVQWLEHASQMASAEASEVLFMLSGLPYLRDGQIFQLPGITIEVAEECSGIRSSWVLLITSTLAANLFLRTGWRRLVLVLVVVPIGIVRNALRIVVISMLCVHIGPEMIHSIVHRRGGPMFFVLSLIPLFAILWWLRQGDRRAKAVSAPGAVSNG